LLRLVGRPRQGMSNAVPLHRNDARMRHGLHLFKDCAQID
jgi:hypothetical protein